MQIFNRMQPSSKHAVFMLRMLEMELVNLNTRIKQKQHQDMIARDPTLSVGELVSFYMYTVSIRRGSYRDRRLLMDFQYKNIRNY